LGFRPKFAIVRAMLNDSIPLSDIKRALVIKLRHHGDVLLTSPVFSVLKNHAPHLEIDALVYAETAPMLTLHPAIAEMHLINRAWKLRGAVEQARSEWRLLQGLLRRRYDLVIHLTRHPRGAWLTRLLRPRYSVAPAHGGNGRLWHGSFTHVYGRPNNARRHTVERNLDALRRIGIYPDIDERRLTLIAGPHAEARIDELLAQHALPAQGFIHLHPTSRWRFKCWPEQSNAELVRELDQRGGRVVLTAAPDPGEMEMVERIVALAQVSVVNLAGQLSLKELAALSARAGLFVGVDSAPMHIAAAMGTPTVALFGPSGDLEWGPWMVPHRLIASQVHPCRPCGIDGCGGGKVSDCLATLPVSRVVEAITQLAREG
jgi:heptosyltransferase-3